MMTGFVKPLPPYSIRVNNLSKRLLLTKQKKDLNFCLGRLQARGKNDERVEEIHYLSSCIFVVDWVDCKWKDSI